MDQTTIDELTAELLAMRAEGATPFLLLLDDTGPRYLGLDGDTLIEIPPERVTFDAAAGFRLTE